VVAINSTSSENKVTFRWTYIVLPALFLLISLILTAIFYPRLPAEAAYHFQNGSPDKWLGRGTLTVWLLVPQIILTLLGFAVVRAALLTARFWPAEGSPLTGVLPVMGNIVALPQLILLFAMAHIFLYNAYQIKLIPLWVFAIIVMVLGGVILGIFFIRTARHIRRRHGNSLRE
jgi:hypothetical protein